MKGRRLLTLSVLTIALACQDNSPPTGPGPRGLGAPGDPAGLISDGAHAGGNPDFFFLPPMVPNPVNSPNYEAGKFNRSLAARLTVEICLLQGPPVNAQGQPVATDCIAGPLVKKFAAGTVELQGGADGHYQVLWKTRESNLDVTKYYRIKVLIEGSAAVFGLADVDPMENKGQLKNTRTGEVIALIDDSTLPIKFRIEKGGGPTLCGGATLCGSGTITNTTPNGEPQFVRVEAADGSFIAGVLIPSGFLPPPPGPQTVVLTIAAVNTGANDRSAGTQATPCHANLPLQQFNSCFHFSTIPQLATIEGSEEGHQFLKPITVAVCFVLRDAEPTDPREAFAQLWSSDEGGEDTKPLPSASAAQILSGPSGQNCGDVLLAVNENSNGFTRFASAGWQKVKSGYSRFFGVQTAYAVDFGIGGLAFDLSNIGPALTAHIRATTSTEFTVAAGGNAAPTVKIEGTKAHNDHPVYNVGIGDLPVTFTLIHLGSEDPPVTQVVNTGEGGFASFDWTPTEPGNYTITAKAQAIGAPVTFTATVTAGLPNPILEFTGFEVGAEFVTYNLNVTNFAAYPAAMFAPAPTLPACGLNDNASRTWVDIYNASNDNRIYGFCALGSPSGLQSIWFAWPVGSSPPSQVYITLIDRATGVTYRSNNVAVTGPPVVGFNILQGSLIAGNHHTCGLTSGGAAYCWGNNAVGQVGDGTTGTGRTTPVAVAGERAFVRLMGGAFHTCGLTSSGAAYCWGNNPFGQLGDGTTTHRNTPVAVAGGLTFASLTVAAGNHTCGRTSAGAAHCWGYNASGQLGDGTTTDRTTPVAVAGGITFASLTAGGLSSGSGHTCGLTSAGLAYCWGFNNFGQLGDGSTTDRTTPVLVAGGLTFTTLAAGGLNSCGLTSGGAAYCWGSNGLGALGDGTTTFRTTPVAVTGGHTFVSLTPGENHHCGLTNGGAAYCWGHNANGQVGDGTTAPRTAPVAVIGEITFTSLTAGAGGHHTCGLTSGGVAYCWGFNFSGQLGDGTTTTRATPAAVLNP